jgi:hypothetical protein
MCQMIFPAIYRTKEPIKARFTAQETRRTPASALEGNVRPDSPPL